MVKKIFLMLAIAFCLSGCLMSQAFKVYETSKGEQISEAKDGVIIFLQYWDFRAGVINELLSAKMPQLSVEAISAFKDLNTLSAKYQADKILTDYEYGRVLGLILKIRYSVAQKLLDIYLPNLFQYIPVTL